MLASHVANWGWTTLTRRLDNVRVFSGCVRATRLRLLNASLQVIRKEAGLEDVRLHDSRYSSASRVLALGMSIFLVEQNVHQALKVAHYFYLLEQGRVTFGGSPGDLEEDEVIQRAYLGSAEQT